MGEVRRSEEIKVKQKRRLKRGRMGEGDGEGGEGGGEGGKEETFQCVGRK